MQVAEAGGGGMNAARNGPRQTAGRRMAKREDMVGMMIFLASDASAYCTGQQYFVEGGWTAM